MVVGGHVVSGLTCQELVELVTAFLDGVLDPWTERRFVDHVASCEGCGAYVDQFRRTIRALGDLPTETLPDHIRDELLRACRERPAHDPTEPPDGRSQ